MRAWMWRLTETNAVLYTEDRQTLNSLLAYARFPYRDAGRAITYARSNGRVYGWQFTIPAEIWNGVVRHLGRQAVTMLDLDTGRRRPTEPQPELPMIPVQPDPPAPTTRTKGAAAKPSVDKNPPKREAQATLVSVSVALEAARSARVSRAAKPAVSKAGAGAAAVAKKDQPAGKLEAPVTPALAKAAVARSKRGAQSTPSVGMTAINVGSEWIPAAPSLAGVSNPGLPLKKRASRGATSQAVVQKPPVPEPVVPEAERPRRKGKSASASALPAQAALPAELASSAPAPARERTPAKPSSTSALPVEVPTSTGEKRTATRSRAPRAASEAVVAPLLGVPESPKAVGSPLKSAEVPAGSRKRSTKASVSPAGMAVSESVVSPADASEALPPARKRGRKPSE